MVDANAQGFVLLFEAANQGFEGLRDALANGGHLIGGEFGAVGIRLVEHKQPRVDAHLVDVFGHLQGDLHAVVVHISHQRHAGASRLEALTDLADGLGVGKARHCEANDFAARLMQPQDAGGGPLHIEGVLVDHRLHHHRVLTADPDVAHPHTAGFAPVDHRVKAWILAPIGVAQGGGGQGAGHGAGQGLRKTMA